MLIKSLKTEADALIFDLEDAVPPEEKVRAREEITKVLACSPDKNIYIRINALNTPWILDDILTVTQYPIKGLVVPKIDEPSDIEKVSWLLDCCEHRALSGQSKLRIIPIIETARGIVNVFSIAKASRRLEAIMFGAMDFILDIDGVQEETGVSLIYPRAAVVTACRASGLLPVDTVYPNFKDQDTLLNECMRAKAMGFGGKACIHPCQITTINQVFSPPIVEVEWAKRVLEAYEEALRRGKGAVTVDGTMVDRPVAEKAKKILALARS
jgi:citrate lyase subunit beta/citryl-CoA lyase